MNEHSTGDQDMAENTHHSRLITDHALETQIAVALQQRAERVHFTPELRERMMTRLPQARRTRLPAVTALASALVAACVLLATLLFPTVFPPQPASLQYTLGTSLAAPAELAQGGQLIALDPTGHHLVYQAANQPGVMYTVDLDKTLTNNTLAMRYALDAAWAPDGSALVATVAPEGASLPLLALIPRGQYMHPLGHDALAANWSPTSRDQITYATLSTNTTTLWNTSTDGQTVHLFATMPAPLLVQHLSWSRDGHHLALTVTANTAPSNNTLTQPGKALYVMDAHTTALQQFVAPGNFTIGTIAWSPDGRYLSYEQSDGQGKTTLQTIEVGKPQHRFSITPQHTLQGWSWSPDSHALVYSDGGTLHTHVLQGASITFPDHPQGSLVSPFWLPDGRILCMHITNGLGTITILTR